MPGDYTIDLGLSVICWLGLSALLYQFVELPGIRLGRAIREPASAERVLRLGA
jgi:hypothetical protein